jgi:hypothetical protein
MLHIKKVKPLFTSIITTGDKFEKDYVENGFVTANKGDLKLWQKVIAIGSLVRDIEVGDMVMINPAGYAKKKYNKNSLQNDLDNNPIITYEFPWVTIEEEEGVEKECLLLSDRDIQYVFEGEEKPDLIIPGKKMLIM